MDQAIALREKVTGMLDGRIESVKGARPIHVVSVTSGKGGVGKTNIVVNVGIAMSKAGLKVMIFDADLGLANVDVLLGLTPRFNIRHVISGECPLKDVIVEGPEGMKILPAASGIDEVTHLSETEKLDLLTHFETYDGDIDVLLIDTGAGIGRNVLYFNSAARQIIVVATPEPTSITDAYALMKVLATRYDEKKFTLLVNNVRNERDAKNVYSNLSNVAERFLNISIDFAGYIPYDSNLSKAVARQKSLIQAYPKSAASQAFESLAKVISKRREDDRMKGSLQFCWKRLLIRN